MLKRAVWQETKPAEADFVQSSLGWSTRRVTGEALLASLSEPVLACSLDGLAPREASVCWVGSFSSARLNWVKLKLGAERPRHPSQ